MSVGASEGKNDGAGTDNGAQDTRRGRQDTWHDMECVRMQRVERIKGHDVGHSLGLRPRSVAYGRDIYLPIGQLLQKVVCSWAANGDIVRPHHVLDLMQRDVDQLWVDVSLLHLEAQLL